MVLRAPHTHLYPGLRLRLVTDEIGDTGPRAAEARGRCVIEFVDGTAAVATLRRDEHGPLLATEPHTTGAGTPIAARRWRLAALPGAGGVAGYRVVRRLG